MKKIMMMVAMLAVSCAMMAQAKFHDAEVNECKGAVKCIKTNRMGQDIVITFSEDGKMSQQGMKDAKYDADGYLQSAKMEMMGNEIEITYKWENGRLVGQKMNVMGQEMNSTRKFNEDGSVAADVIDMGGQKMESPYTNYKFDAKGNWISRTGEMMGQTMEQTRTIEYYE
jgi:opacity protein-like surface antigen